MVLQSLHPEQLTVTNTVAVLDKLYCIQEGDVACYGPGGFHWMSIVGNLSVVYDKIDPDLACDSHAPPGFHQKCTPPAPPATSGGLLWLVGRPQWVTGYCSQFKQICLAS